ncbi:GspH/FimT family pseudopilin [Acidovorax sp. sif1233]|uniref:GspH/FimT family pseudopilin n=1 Tax=Acidovorax sp. sif1233 TaxID=2854792 RepID=UPI00351CF5A5
MVVITIVAILAALATPSFTPLIERWRVRQATEELQSTLYYARSEAIKRGGGISIVQNSNNGWAVYFDANSNGNNEANEVLQSTSSPPRLSITFPANVIAVDRWGTLTVAADFLIKPDGKADDDVSAQRVCVSAGGRIKTEKGANAC